MVALGLGFWGWGLETVLWLWGFQLGLGPAVLGPMVLVSWSSLQKVRRKTLGKNLTWRRSLKIVKGQSLNDPVGHTTPV